MLPGWLVVLLGLGVIGWIFAATPAGRRLRRRLPIAAWRPGAAPKRDRAYLLRVCGGDPAQVERLLRHERSRNPELSEAEAYRRAIRAYLRDRS